MTRRGHPEVDEDDVAEMVAALARFITKRSAAGRMTPETRADIAFDVVFNLAKLQGSTPTWAKELARKVRKRILWRRPSD